MFRVLLPAEELQAEDFVLISYGESGLFNFSMGFKIQGFNLT